MNAWIDVCWHHGRRHLLDRDGKFFPAIYFAVQLLWTKKNNYLNNILRRVKLKEGEKRLIVEMSSNRKAVFL